MTTEQQIKALAELDGWYQCNEFGGVEPRYVGTPSETHVAVSYKPYLASYDAIIPLIQKQIGSVISDVCRIIREDVDFYFPCATPPQLCEALLRVTGKWTK